MLQHLVDHLRHTLLAFESTALNALEALRVWFLSEHLLFVGKHYIYIVLLSIINE